MTDGEIGALIAIVIALLASLLSNRYYPLPKACAVAAISSTVATQMLIQSLNVAYYGAIDALGIFVGTPMLLALGAALALVVGVVKHRWDYRRAR